MSNCWKSHAAAQLFLYFDGLLYVSEVAAVVWEEVWAVVA